MPNVLYDGGREGILDRTIDMTGDVRVMLVSKPYQFDPRHKFVPAIGEHDNGRSHPLSSKTFTKGVFDAANTEVIPRRSVSTIAIVLYQFSGVDSTARLIAYVDDPISGLPFTPVAGRPVEILWSNGPSRIFKL